MRRIITVFTALALVAPLAACEGEPDSQLEGQEPGLQAPLKPASTPPVALPAEPGAVRDDAPGNLTWISSRDALQKQMNARSERFAERRQDLEGRIEDDAAEDVREANNALNAAIYDFESALSELSGVTREDFDAAGERLRSTAQEVELRLMELSERISDDARADGEPEPTAHPVAPKAPEGATKDDGENEGEEFEPTQPDGLAPMPRRAAE